MSRPDLLALSDDDLATLANRGLVKRARRELESGEPAGRIEEAENGDVTVRWDDAIVCALPADKRVNAEHCSCPATELCRHLLRSVMLYQTLAAHSSDPCAAPSSTLSISSMPSIPSISHGNTDVWDPGQIPDHALNRHYSKLQISRAQARLEQGLIVELRRSAKPSALFHDLSLTTRFLVPGDLRYTHCDCREEAPCSHVLLAVWAFRQMPAEQATALLATAEAPAPPIELLDAVEESISELVRTGVEALPDPVLQRLRRHEARCRQAGLIWPADVLADLLVEQHRYHAHDARFSPEQLVRLIGELCIRMDAIRSDTGAVLPWFVRGMACDRETEVGSARLIGLGCQARVGRGGVALATLMQDVDSGMVVAVTREFSNPDPASGVAPPSIEQLAGRIVLQQQSLASLSRGQMLIKGGRRAANARFVPGRARFVYHPQSFRWEELRAPLLAESFAELREHLALQPPAPLRSRRLTENFFVCPVAGASDVRFDRAEQVLVAALQDHDGESATLRHPFFQRAQAGFDGLMGALRSDANQLRFVAATFLAAAGGLEIAPAALIFEHEAGRRMVQPWIDGSRSDPVQLDPSSEPSLASVNPIHDFPTRLIEALGRLLLQGLDRAGGGLAAHWRELIEAGQGSGYNQSLCPAERLGHFLVQRRSVLQTDTLQPTRDVLALAVLAVMAHELAL